MKTTLRTNITIKVARIIKGPNGMYSSVFFFFVTSNITLIIAPSKNEITAIITTSISPNTSPRAPISFTSPKPIASFPAIAPPINVISRNIPPPAIIPRILSKNTFILDKPVINVKISATYNIVNVNLLGIICFL